MESYLSSPVGKVIVVGGGIGGIQRGPKGGHLLARRPEEITLGQIVKLFETRKDLVECISFPQKCHQSVDCRLRMVWKEASEALYEKLDSTTIADLIV